MLKTTDVLQAKGNTLVEELAAKQRAKGIRDTGYSADNTRAEVDEMETGGTLRIVGPAYWGAQNSGRGPNPSGKPSRLMVKAMKAWAVRHGMDEAAGYPIAAKIAREGTKVPNAYNSGNVVSEALDPARITDELTQTLTPLINQQVKAALFA